MSSVLRAGLDGDRPSERDRRRGAGLLGASGPVALEPAAAADGGATVLAQAPQNAAVRVTVVVPTYRRPMLLDRCLAALLRQDFDCERYEIIVCDDGPDAATRATVEARAVERQHCGPVIRYLPIEATQGPAGARNAGWRAAQGAIIAFTDDDTEPSAQWLKRGCEALADGAAAATGGVKVPLANPARPTDHEADTRGLETAEFVTANCFVRRTVLASLNGFDERFTAAWREDSDLQFRILAQGGRIVPAPEALVVHPVRPAPWGVSIKAQKKSQYDALLYKVHRQQFRSRIRRHAPWDYYLIVALIAVALVSLCLGAPGVAGLAALGWLGMTAHFVYRRLRHGALTPSHIAEMVWTSILIPPLSIFWRLVGAWRFKVLFL